MSEGSSVEESSSKKGDSCSKIEDLSSCEEEGAEVQDSFQLKAAQEETVFVFLSFWTTKLIVMEMRPLP